MGKSTIHYHIVRFKMMLMCMQLLLWRLRPRHLPDFSITFINTVFLFWYQVRRLSLVKFEKFAAVI